MAAGFALSAEQQGLPLLNIRIGLTAPPATLSARRNLLQRSGDNRTRTDDPLRAKQVLSQLSYAPLSFPYTPFRGNVDPLPIHFFIFIERVGRVGLEPTTLRL